MPTNNWEVCPKCHGQEGVHCHICDSTGLINSLTGLPPIKRSKIKETEGVKVGPSVTYRHDHKSLQDLLREAEIKNEEKAKELERQAWINRNSQQIHLGSFPTIEEASDYWRSLRATGMRPYINQVETTKTEL